MGMGNPEDRLYNRKQKMRCHDRTGKDGLQMKKFAFIGAGSFGFTRNLVRDLLTFPAFQDCELALMDINPERLDKITQAVEKIVRVMKVPAKITPTLNRAEALEGADGVVCTVFNGDIDIWRYDIEVPRSTEWTSMWEIPGVFREFSVPSGTFL